VCDGPNQRIQVLLGRPNGVLAPPVSYGLGDWARGITAGDLDGDGHADVMVGLGDGVGWLRGRGDGSLGATTHIPIPGDPGGALRLGDLDGDGRLDLVAANWLSSQVSVVHNVCR